jgi:hypothetical protein
MEVSPSLHSQVIQLSKEDDNHILCVTGLAYKLNTLTSFLKVTESTTAAQIDQWLPLNLKPLAVTYLKSDKEEIAKKLAESLGITAVYRFDLKNETWIDIAQGTELNKRKDDVFLESLLFGLTVELDPAQLSSSILTRKGIRYSCIGDHSEKLWHHVGHIEKG